MCEFSQQEKRTAIFLHVPFPPSLTIRPDGKSLAKFRLSWFAVLFDLLFSFSFGIVITGITTCVWNTEGGTLLWALSALGFFKFVCLFVLQLFLVLEAVSELTVSLKSFSMILR